ncbi:MAG: EamA family transporter [Clostridiales bacterium]|nr:EamA family transporter [Clostridiales bacterium]
MVFIIGSANQISQISSRTLLFLLLSGMATGASWLFYFKALSMGDVNKVVPIDKSSTIMSVTLAIIVFQETNHLWLKLISMVLLGTGIFMMVEKKAAGETAKSRIWILYAFLGAVFAALTSIFGKIGIENVESNLGTAIRTGVVLIMAWSIILMKGKQSQIKNIDKRELLFISLSGLATGSSWLCYYYALQNGIVSVVVPIDKMSIVVAVGFSYFVFKEKLSKKAFIGLTLMVAGTLLMVAAG